MATTIDPAELLHEYAAGATYRDLGQRHGIGHETARQLVIAAEDDLVFRVLTDFVSALRAEAQGQEPEWPSFVVPYGPDRTTALRVFDRIRKRLRDRGLPFRILTRSVKPSATRSGARCS